MQNATRFLGKILNYNEIIIKKKLAFAIKIVISENWECLENSVLQNSNNYNFKLSCLSRGK